MEAIDKINEEYEILLDELKDKLTSNRITEVEYHKYLQQINFAYNLDLTETI